MGLEIHDGQQMPLGDGFAELFSQRIVFGFPLESLTTSQKLDLLSSETLGWEDLFLRKGLSIKKEAKLLYLCAGLRNLTTLNDFDGNPIHTRVSDHHLPKISEITEAWQVFYELSLKPDVKVSGEDHSVLLAHGISELLDVIYCLAHMRILDPEHEEQYRGYIDGIAEHLGIPLDQLLDADLLKYDYRLGHGKSEKDIPREEAMVDSLINSGKLSFLEPEKAPYKITELFNYLGDLSENLTLRYGEMYQEHLKK